MDEPLLLQENVFQQIWATFQVICVIHKTHDISAPFLQNFQTAQEPSLPDNCTVGPSHCDVASPIEVALPINRMSRGWMIHSIYPVSVSVVLGNSYLSAISKKGDLWDIHKRMDSLSSLYSSNFSELTPKLHKIKLWHISYWSQILKYLTT